MLDADSSAVYVFLRAGALRPSGDAVCAKLPIQSGWGGEAEIRLQWPSEVAGGWGEELIPQCLLVREHAARRLPCRFRPLDSGSPISVRPVREEGPWESGRIPTGASPIEPSMSPDGRHVALKLW